MRHNGHRRTAEAVEANVGGRETEADRVGEQIRRDVRAMQWDELTSLLERNPAGDSGYAALLFESAAREVVRRLDEHQGVAA